MKKSYQARFSITLILCLFLVSCNMPSFKSAAQPTLNVTQAYETVNARLTNDAASKPSVTPRPSATQTPAGSQVPTSISATASATTQPSATVGVVSTCDLAAAGNPIDVTIPDDTVMKPGQAFQKVWRLKNAGTCTWTKAYSISFVSGEAMGAPPAVPMPFNVAPGQEVDIAVDLVAPNTPGTYRGDWKLRNAAGQYFGIGPNGGATFWVKIVVSGGTPGTPVVTATSSTPIQITGTKVMAPGDSLNLDNGQLRDGGGDDLAYGVDGIQPLLKTINGAAFGVWGGSQPSYSDCQSVSMGSGPLNVVDDIGPGRYVCFRTNLGLFGWFVLTNFDVDGYALTVQFLTWAAP